MNKFITYKINLTNVSREEQADLEEYIEGYLELNHWEFTGKITTTKKGF